MIIRKAADDVRSAIKKKPTEEPEKHEVATSGLSTGSTLLNLALSGHPRFGFAPGKYYLLVGDSNSGKTFTSMTCFAEATKDPAFANHMLIYDNIEDGMLMDVDRLFGKDVAKRLRAPAGTRDEPKFSETIEEFYYNVDDIAKKGKPFIYILDSMDGLSSSDEQKKFDEQKKAHETGKDVAGSYGDGKAKKNSANLRKILSSLRQTDSILIIISQTRDNLTGWGDPKTRSGGKALRFYATCEIWTSPVGAIKKTVRGKERSIGTQIKIQTKKNRLTGKLGEVQIAIYPSYGIDDVGSCIDFLVSEGWWKKTGGKIDAGEHGTFTREKLVSIFDGIGKFKVLRKEVANCWKEIDEDSSLKREPKYA